MTVNLLSGGLSALGGRQANRSPRQKTTHISTNIEHSKTCHQYDSGFSMLDVSAITHVDDPRCQDDDV